MDAAQKLQNWLDGNEAGYRKSDIAKVLEELKELRIIARQYGQMEFERKYKGEPHE